MTHNPMVTDWSGVRMSTNIMYYKYRKFSHESLSMFINKEIYFAPPTSFNDPFDGQINIKHAAELALKEFEKNLNVEACDYLTTMLQSVDIDKISDRVRKVGIFSLSAIQREILLWSHYADEHKGFCVGFELNKDENIFGNTVLQGPWEVEYTRSNPYLEFFKDTLKDKQDKKYFKLLLLAYGFTHKATNWQYEKEYRLIKDKPGVVEYPPSMVKEIIFGLRMLPKDKRTLKALLSGDEWKHVTFHQAFRHGYELQLKTRIAADEHYRD